MPYYYPYSYGNYGNYNPYMPMNYTPTQLQYQPNQSMQPMQQNIQTPQTALNGKVVDSEDVVKATEVPIGGYGIFPKADLSEIYVKSWNNNGTTSLITFKPYIQPVQDVKDENSVSNPQSSAAIDAILQKVSSLENKLDTILSIKKENAVPQIHQIQQIQPQQTIQQKEGLKANGY